MKTALLTMMMSLSYASLAGATTVVKQANTLAAHLVDARQPSVVPAPEAPIRTFILQAQMEVPPVDDCSTAFAQVDAGVRTDAPRMSYLAGAHCTWTSDNPNVQVDVIYAMEAGYSEDVATVEAYFAAHQGEQVWGATLDFRPALAVIADAHMIFSERTGNTTAEVGDVQQSREFANMQQLFRWVRSANQTVSTGTPARLLAWLQSDLTLSEVIASSLLHEANFLNFSSVMRATLEDSSSLALPTDLPASARDCRRSASRHCL